MGHPAKKLKTSPKAYRYRWFAGYINPEFGELVAQRRHDLGKSQMGLAEDAGVSQAVISYLETRRKTLPKPDFFWALYNALEFHESGQDAEEMFRWAYFYELGEAK